MKKKILIEGMSCGHCSNHVKEALSDLGATDIEVDLKEKMATAELGDTTDENIKAAIEDAGYDVVGIENL